MRLPIRLFITTLLLCCLVALPRHSLASTDPQSATVSATASIASQNEENDEEAPTPPILIRPYDGSVSRDNHVELVWSPSSDPNGNTIYYTVYLNGVATYLGISNTGNSAGSNYTARLDSGEVRLTPTIALADGEYDWYVTATDLSGNTSHSQTWHFTIDTHAPPLIIVDIDRYHDPVVTEGSNFDIDGPKDVYFTIQSEPNTLITVTINSFPPQTYRTNAQGLAYPHRHLDVGLYPVVITATDAAQNQTTAPTFILTVRQSVFTITLPTTPGGPSTILIPYSPLSLPSLPASVAYLTADRSLAALYAYLLALGVLLLLIILWKRRDNILIIDAYTKKPVDSFVLYHSRPHVRPAHSSVFMTRHEPLYYEASRSDHGQLYVPRLARYSTLTVRIGETTHILSLSVNQRFYTIAL